MKAASSSPEYGALPSRTDCPGTHKSLKDVEQEVMCVRRCEYTTWWRFGRSECRESRMQQQTTVFTLLQALQSGWLMRNGVGPFHAQLTPL
eukprot:scaffold18376_cov160-Skeletonema_menzelii.AAC.9